MMTQVMKSFLLETIRNTGVFIGNMLPAFIFIICSWACSLGMKNDAASLDFIIKGQFLPISIMILVFSASFSISTVYLADLKGAKTLQWLKRTNLKATTYFLGIAIGVFCLMNVALVLLLAGYALLISISMKAAISIILFCNFVLLALYPVCFILAGVAKNGKTIQSYLTVAMLILMFSITMPSLFLTIANKQPQDYYIFLAWNPMLYLTDILHFQLNLNAETWLPSYQYAIILATICLVLSIAAKKIYMR